MKLSKDEVQKIAKLSRLDLDAKELDQFAHQLSDVLDYFDKLKKQKRLVFGGERKKQIRIDMRTCDGNWLEDIA